MVAGGWNVTKSSAIECTADRPDIAACIRDWYISGAGLIPYGQRRNRKRPKGDSNVFREFDSSSSFKCQNADFASVLLNTLALLNFGRMSPTVGM